MTTRIRVDLDHLDSVTARLAGLVGFVEDRLAELDRHVAQLPDRWLGTAADAHASAHRTWHEAAREMNTALDALRAAAKLAHGEYTQAVATNLAMLGRGTGQ